jgi:hypothetical protein
MLHGRAVVLTAFLVAWQYYYVNILPRRKDARIEMESRWKLHPGCASHFQTNKMSKFWQ